MTNKLLLRAVGLGILMPTTLVAAFGSLPGAGLSLGAIRAGTAGLSATLWLVALVAGWFGMVTLWRLYYGFLRERSGLNRVTTWVGLVCGSLVSLALVTASGGSLTFRVLFFGWPLWAVAFFVVALARQPVRDNHQISVAR